MNPVEIQDIFKIPIYKAELSLDVDELEKICHQYKDNNEGRVISNIGGYQSNDLSLDELAIKSLIKEIEKHSSDFAKFFINSNRQVLDNMWINVNLYRDFNKSHNHPNCSISGVYYVKTPDKCGNITFEHPATDVLSLYNSRLDISKFNTINSQEWWFEPCENHLYLFPAWLKHFVTPNMNKKEERISISFNTR